MNKNIYTLRDFLNDPNYANAKVVYLYSYSVYGVVELDDIYLDVEIYDMDCLYINSQGVACYSIHLND